MKKLLLIFLVSGGCHSSLKFTCSTNDQCRVGATQGICVQPAGVCALPAADCPSGYRYDPSAGSLGGNCVGEIDNNDMSGVTDDMGTDDMAIQPGQAIPAQLIYPSSGSFVESKRPLLRWSVPTAGGIPAVEICSTRSCLSTLSTVTIDASGSSGRPDAELPRGNVFWRVKTTTPLGSAYSPIWLMNVPGRESGKTTAWGTLSDFDGDGKSEFVSAAWCAENTGATSFSNCNGPGKVYVYAVGSENAPVVLNPLTQATAYFGQALAAVDFNGDGYADLAVGAPGLTVNAVTNTGVVYIFKGSANGIQTANPIVLNAPDPGAFFGSAIAGGDIDGDGYSDLVVGGPNVTIAGGGNGRLYVYYGGPNGPRGQPTPLDSPDGGGTGHSAAIVDVNGDGYGDVVGTAPLVTVSGTTTGRLYFWLSGSNGLSTMAHPINAGGSAGNYGLGPAGDIDGDGYPDVLLLNMNNASVYRGSPTGLIDPASITIMQPSDITGNVGFAGGGSGLRDVDGDGFDDVAIAAPSTTDGGRVCVYRGSNTGLVAQPNMEITATTLGITLPADGRLGQAISYSDTEADGIGDIVMTAPCKGEVTAGQCDGPGFILVDPDALSGGLTLLHYANGTNVAFSRFGFAAR